MAADIWISPHHRLSEYPRGFTLDDKIELFEDRTIGWQLDIAEQMANGKKDKKGRLIRRGVQHSGYAVLQVLFSYFESTAKFRAGVDGSRQSGRYFKAGVLWVFPKLNQYPTAVVNEALDALYEKVRCGLYHASSPAGLVNLSAGHPSVIAFDPNSKSLAINPHLLPATLRDHLLRYVQDLRDTTRVPLRQNFEKRFDFQWNT